MKKKLTLFVVFVGIFILLGTRTTFALEQGTISSNINSTTEISTISEPTSTDIFDDAKDEFQSDLAKIFEEEIVQYIMYGLSALFGGSLVPYIFWFVFKKWLKKKVKENDEINIELNNTIKTANDTISIANNLMLEQNRRTEDTINKVELLTTRTEEAISKVENIEEQINSINKALEIVLLRDKETIKNGNGVRVAKVLKSRESRKTSESEKEEE